MAHQPRLREPPPQPQQLELRSLFPHHVPRLRRCSPHQRRPLAALVDVCRARPGAGGVFGGFQSILYRHLLSCMIIVTPFLTQHWGVYLGIDMDYENVVMDCLTRKVFLFAGRYGAHQYGCRSGWDGLNKKQHFGNGNASWLTKDSTESTG